MQVRLQPELLQVLDDVASEVGITRPEAVRYVFAQWAKANDHIKPREKLTERSVMLNVQKETIARIEKQFGAMPVDEAINFIVTAWLEGKEASDG
ncbi:hypothetical protein [Pararhizobium gei]|uniref:hypothetical protein n=1 Tax=Pararhizobium gei TaxID=1395951 RepID=UPI0023DA35D8|nr:hypothetical protein [Rhizobium gei]